MFAALPQLSLGYIVINLDPIAISLGPLQIHWYGLAYVLAISLALWATLRYADTLGISRDHVWNIFLWTAIAGLIGARLYFVIQQPHLVDNYLKNPKNIIDVTQGGMAFFGAIFLGAPTAAYLAWRAGLSPWIAFDMGALFAAVGQMFGRLGNLVNGDIVGYSVGTPVIPGSLCANAPCVAYVSDPHYLAWSTAYMHPASFIAEHGTLYQPAAAYEILFNLFALAILWPLRLILPRRVRAGAFFCAYLVMYSVGQIIIFFTRSNEFVDFLGVHSLKQAQWTAIFTLVFAGFFYWFIVRRFGKVWAYDHANPAPLLAINAVQSETNESPSVATRPSTPRAAPASLASGRSRKPETGAEPDGDDDRR